jgi:hypothetical protein
VTDYTKITDFAAKDALSSGNSAKIVNGTEINTEFANIATAVATKSNVSSPTFTGTLTAATLSITGNTTLGNAASDTITFTGDVSSHILPSADATYNLGASGSEWNDLYVDGTAYVDAINFNGTGITSTAAELNILDGVTATAAELNILDGVTSTAAELNILDGVTSTAAELNILDGVTATFTELNYTDGVTSNIQTQIDALQDLDADLTAIAALSPTDGNFIVGNGSAWVAESGATVLASVGVTATAAELNILDGVTSTFTELNLLDGVTSTTAELNYTDGVTSNIQTQLDALQDADADLTAIGALAKTDGNFIVGNGSTWVAEAGATVLASIGVTATLAEVNIMDGVTATTAELNILDGVTSTAAELNILDGVTSTAAELNYLDLATLGTSAASKAVTADANNVVTFTSGIYEEFLAVTSSSNATTIDLRLGTNFLHDLTEATTFTFSNPAASGLTSTFTLKIIQDSTARAITWPAAVDWPAATAPTLTATNNGVDYFVFTTNDGGTVWYGFTAGQAMG